MIDWVYVGTNSLWILGLSILLAALSYHDWLARETGQRRRALFRRLSWRLPLWTGMASFCIGVGLGRELSWWERIFWAALALSAVWQLARQLRSRRRPPGRPT